MYCALAATSCSNVTRLDMETRSSKIGIELKRYAGFLAVGFSLVGGSIGFTYEIDFQKADFKDSTRVHVNWSLAWSKRPRCVIDK